MRVRSCSSVGAGTFQNRAGQTQCETCGVGFYSSDDATACTQRRGCKNGGMSVPDGWRGPGWGNDYCNSCKCSDSKLMCTTRKCYNRASMLQRECSHTTCQKKSVRIFTGPRSGQMHDVIKTLHHHEEEHGDSISCQFSQWLNRCECLCTHTTTSV